MHVSHLSYYKLLFRPITLTVAKCWDPTPKGYFTLPPSMYQFFVLCNRPISLCVMWFKFSCELVAEIWALYYIRERFYNNLKMSKFIRICMRNHLNVTRWQELFFHTILLIFRNLCFKIYNRKCTGYVILICSFSSC